MTEETFTTQDLIDYIVHDVEIQDGGYTLSFDDALQFITAFTNYHGLEIDNKEKITDAWYEEHGH